MAQSQTQKILAHLASGASITSTDAFRRYGIARLASRINDLRRKGHPVQKQMIPFQNRYGQIVYVAEYWIEKQPERKDHE